MYENLSMIRHHGVSLKLRSYVREFLLFPPLYSFIAASEAAALEQLRLLWWWRIFKDAEMRIYG